MTRIITPQSVYPTKIPFKHCRRRFLMFSFMIKPVLLGRGFYDLLPTTLIEGWNSMEGG